MRHSWASYFGALLLYAAALLACPAGAQELRWGVNGHPMSAYPGISIDVQLNRVKALGLSSYRVNLGFTTDLEKFDSLLLGAQRRGIQVIPVITHAIKDTDTASALFQAAFAAAHAYGSRYKGQVPAWELGNEMENFAIIRACEMRDNGTQYPCNWGPASGVGPLDYYGPRWAKVSAVLRGLSEGMAAADPQALRAMGTAGWGHVGAFYRMKADGIDWDISVWHWYGADTNLATFLPRVASYGKPIWITEFNAGQGSQWGQKVQAEILQQRFATLRRLAPTYRIEMAQVYELFDEPYWTGIESQMGLITMVKDSGGHWIPGPVKLAYYTTVQNSRE